MTPLALWRLLRAWVARRRYHRVLIARSKEARAGKVIPHDEVMRQLREGA
jgi:hypothetical protein